MADYAAGLLAAASRSFRAVADHVRELVAAYRWSGDGLLPLKFVRLRAELWAIVALVAIAVAVFQASQKPSEATLLERIERLERVVGIR